MLHETLNDEAEFPIMRLGNAITSQALKPGLLHFSTIVGGLGMLNLVLLLVLNNLVLFSTIVSTIATKQFSTI